MRLAISCPGEEGKEGGIFTLDTESGEVECAAEGHSIALIHYKEGYLHINSHIELLELDKKFEPINATIVFPVNGGRYHDLLAEEDGVWIVDSVGSRIVWMKVRDDYWTECGAIAILPNATRHFDAMHLNCLHKNEDIIYATAYGMYESSDAWRRVEKDNGVLLDLSNSKLLLTGLSKPHTPRIDGDSGILCDSALGDIVNVKVKPDGFWEITNRIHIGDGFTRGLLEHDGGWFVGLSGSRYADSKREEAELCFLKGDKVEQRWAIPAPEIYDIVEAL